MPAAAAHDPWAQVPDLCGTALYERLGLTRRASAADVRAAFRAAARTHHPDKGGSAAEFAALRHAFEVLSDPVARATYDECAPQLKYRYVPGVTPRAPGGEGELLDELVRLGVVCEAGTQLVCVCEVCGRPSTKECFVCTMRFCEFCTRKPHWKGKFGLHWPVHNSAHMVETLGRKQLEKKRIEDGERAARAVPQWRSEGELKEVRAFKEAAAALGAAGGVPDFRLTRFYMWAQSATRVFVAVHVPTGYGDRALRWEATVAGLKVQAEDSPPVVHRTWAAAVDADAAVDAIRSDDNRLLALTVRKAVPGERWRALFAGDSDGARCLRPPYALAEADDDVLLEWPLPPGTAAADVTVDVTHDGIDVAVRGGPRLRRTFWEDADARLRAAPGAPRRGAVAPEACAWTLRDGGADEDGAPCRALSLLLAKPPRTEDEIRYRAGVRLDNRAAEHTSGPVVGRKGFRFFEDDADAFGLEDVLQALCFAHEGRTWAPPPPHAQYHAPHAQPHWATSVQQLSPGARKQLQLLERAQEAAT